METFKMTQNRKVVSLTPAKHLSNNKLKIQTSKFGLGLKHKESTNSATLPNQGMNLQSFRKIRRMSTLGLHQFNKSVASNFTFKNLKELAKSEEVSDSSSEEEELHGKSIFLFGKTNKFRKVINKIVSNSWFDSFILVCILISSITLAIENPLDDPDSKLSQYLNIINMTMTFIFLVECVLKIIASGFLFNGKLSYLRNPWNIVDFFIVIVSLSSMVTSSNLTVFKAIRVLRLLRPLRVIQRNEGLKIAVQALFMAVPNIFYVSVIAILFFAIFGMTGVNIFKGKFFS